MKKLKLLFAICALMVGGVSVVQAQWTDCTSAITNPSFETDDAIADLTTCGWATNRATGWTILPASASNSQVGVGNSSSKLQGIGTSHAPSAGDKFFYMRNNWNKGTEYSAAQTLTNLPSGMYRLSLKISYFSTKASTYTISIQEEGQTAVTSTINSADNANVDWQTITLFLNKKQDGTSITIKAAMKAGDANGGQHYCMLLDDFQLMKADNPATPIETGTTDVYLANKSTGQFLSAGASWGTHSILDEVGHEMTATLNDGFYKLKTQQFNNCYFGSNLYMDNGTAANWLFLETSAGSGEYYMTLDGVNYLASNGAGAELITVSQVTDAAIWTITTKSERISSLSNATKAKPTNATFFINDQNFGRSNLSSGWTRTSGTADYTGKAGNNENYNWQKWNGAVDYNQSLTGLPNGKYQMKVQGFYRPGANDTKSTAQNASVYAGAWSTPLALVSSPHIEAQDNGKGFTTANTNEETTYYVPNSQSNASTAFSAGYYENTVNDIIVTDGTLTVGVKNEGTVSNQWTVVDNFRLFYYGNTLTNEAEEITKGATMVAGKWYYFDITVDGDYKLNIATLSDVVYTTDGGLLMEDGGTVTTNFANNVVTLTAGRYYVKSASAQTFNINPNTLEYTVGTATSSITEGSYTQSLTTVTFTYAGAATNDENATLGLGTGTVKLLNSQSAEVATAELSLTDNVVTATFSNVTLDLNSSYTLAIAANVIGYAAGATYNEAQNITFHTPVIADGFYYVKTSVNQYLSRGANYNTQAIADSYGLPLNIRTRDDGITEFIFVDSWFHLFDANNGAMYTDNNTAINFALEVTEGGYFIVNKNATTNSTYDYKLYIDAADGNRVKASNTNATVWQFESTATDAHKIQMQAVKDAQAAAAATAASINGVTTQAGMKTYLDANYFETSATITGTDGVKESYQQGGGNGQNSGPLEIFKETVSDLTPGLYRLSVNAFERITWPGDVYNAGGAPGISYVYANDQMIQLASLFDYPADTKWKNTDVTFGGKYYPDRTDAAQAAFEAGSYENVVYVWVAADEGKETGSITFGINKPHRYGNDSDRGAWICYNNFKLDFLQNKDVILAEIVESLNKVPNGKMNGDVQTTLNIKKENAQNASKNNSSNQLNTILTELNEAIAAANASIEAYTAAATAIDKATALKEAHNFASAIATSTFANAIAAIANAYEDGSLADVDANAAGTTLGVAATGWRANPNGAAVQYMNDGFSITGYVDNSLYVNTWSTEGSTDGSDFTVPFYEYWNSDANSLAQRTWTGTLTDLPNGQYKISAWVRVRAKNETAATDATGITIAVNDGDAVDVTEGTQIGESQFQIATYEALGLVKDGTLNFNVNIADGNNISWLAFKNVKYTKVRDLTPEEAAVKPTAIALDPTTVTLNATTNTATLTPTFTPQDATQTVTWTSSDEGVATVNNGVVTGVAPGTATITVTSTIDANVKATATVTVSYPETVYETSTFTNDGATRNIYSLGENIIKNGTFEYPNGYYGWKNGAGGDLAAANFDIVTEEDNKYLKAKNSEGAGSANSISTAWPIEAGKTYVFGYKVKASTTVGDKSKYLVVSMTNTPGTETKKVSKDDETVNEEWNSIKYEFTNTEGYAYVQFRARWLANSLSFDDFYLAEATTTTVGNVEYATAAIPTANIGTGAFQYSQDAIDAANALVQGTATVDDVKAAYNAVTTLNSPEETQAYNIVFNCEGHNYTGNALTLVPNPNQAQGYYGLKYLAPANVNLAQAFYFVHTTGNKYKVYAVDTDGNDRYITTQAEGYGTTWYEGIRTITDASKAMEIEIRPNGEGLYLLWNTGANKALAHNGNTNNDLFTNNTANFQFVETTKPSITINTTAAGWGTTILPFAVASLPEGVKVYTISESNGNALTMVEHDAIEANKPYVIEGAWSETLTGDAQGTALKNTEGLLVGTYTRIPAPDGSYILQKQGDKVGFFKVDTSVAEPNVPANRAYLSEEASSVRGFLLDDSEVITAINAVKALTEGEALIYDMNGVQQPRLKKGMNIIRTKDGRTQKVMVR